RIDRRALKNRTMIALAAAAFIGIFFFDVPFPIIVLAAALLGFIGGRAGLDAFLVAGGHGAKSGKRVTEAESLLGESSPPHTRPGAGWLFKVGVAGVVLWLGPVLLIIALLGVDHVYAQIGIFFAKMAVVTFGGAYAVLAYVAQQAVDHYGWLRPGEMLDGLGMAETTPGPLIMVTQFVGFLAAFREPGGLHPMLAGTLGGLLTTWVTFTPCFLWIFFGAPFVEALRGNKALSAALGAITAAVVGVILNLAIWFALHVLFAQLTPMNGLGMSVSVPVLASINVPSFVLTAGAVLAVFWLRIGMIPVLAACSLAGVVYYLAIGLP
ncbi:MAG TPA: chromate transporter, partial [Vineibacter sp.]|nr:chromate transporter [Vineibacter sp.]